MQSTAGDVANVSDLGIRQSQIACDMILASSVATNDSHENFFVRAFGAGRSNSGEGCGQASGNDGSLFEKITAIDLHGYRKDISRCADKKTSLRPFVTCEKPVNTAERCSTSVAFGLSA